MHLIRTFMSPGRVQDTVRLQEGIHMEDYMEVPRELGSLARAQGVRQSPWLCFTRICHGALLHKNDLVQLTRII